MPNSIDLSQLGTPDLNDPHAMLDLFGQLKLWHDNYQASLTADIASAIGFSSFFESSEQTITANTDISVAHRLGKIPKLHWAILRCKAPDFGFTVGQETTCISNTGVGNDFPNTYVDTTNIGVVIAVGVDAMRRNAPVGAAVVLTLANWKIV